MIILAASLAILTALVLAQIVRWRTHVAAGHLGVHERGYSSEAEQLLTGICSIIGVVGQLRLDPKVAWLEVIAVGSGTACVVLAVQNLRYSREPKRKLATGLWIVFVLLGIGKMDSLGLAGLATALSLVAAWTVSSLPRMPSSIRLTLPLAAVQLPFLTSIGQDVSDAATVILLDTAMSILAVWTSLTLSKANEQIIQDRVDHERGSR